MTRFFAGEKVIIRYGTHQGKKAIIMKTQPSDAYKVKAENGFILFYSSRGLEKEQSPKGCSL